MVSRTNDPSETVLSILMIILPVETRSHHMTEIMKACQKGDMVTVWEGISRHPKQDGQSLLTMACINNRIDLIKVLLDRFQFCQLHCLESIDHDGNTALIHAITRGYCEVMHVLLICGANPNHVPPDHCSVSPLMMDTFDGQKTLVRMLLSTQGGDQSHGSSRENGLDHCLRQR